MTTRTTTQIEALRERVATQLGERLDVHIDRITWDADRIARHQRDRLGALLAHALENSPFHARRLAGVDPKRVELSELPVMTKAEMMESFDDVVTDRRIRLADVEQHLTESIEEPSLLFDEYVCLASGGSSGLRGVFVHAVSEYLEFGSSVMRRACARGRAMGVEQLHVALVAASSPIHSTGFAAATVRGGPLVFYPAPATLPIDEIVARLNELQPPLVFGYPSTLSRLAREQDAGRLRIAPMAITSTSEPLTPEDRATIAAAFGVPLIDQFASTEGLAGSSDPDSDVINFASDMCIVELVDERRALVTNLHNFTQPLIRYELTDCLVRQPDSPDHGHLRATVRGRADDVFRYGDVEIHPHVIRSVLVKAPTVREYEIRQSEQGLDASVVADGYYGELGAALESALRDAGLEDPQVRVRSVDCIWPHPATGKVRRFIPL
jgi:phenylacetate-CoA ligase